MENITKFYFRRKGDKFIKFYLGREDHKLKFTRRAYLKFLFSAICSLLRE